MAVVKIAGKQFVVAQGQIITVPYLDLEIGKILKTKDLLSEDQLEFEVIDQKRSEKIMVLKFRNKSRYQRLIGQRTKLTVVKNVIAQKAAKTEKAEKPAKIEKIENKEKSSAKKS